MKPLDSEEKALPLEVLVEMYPESAGLKLLLSRQMAAQPMEGETICVYTARGIDSIQGRYVLSNPTACH